MAAGAMDTPGGLRRLEPQWNNAMILASIAISLLGAFTSTQLMCQARMSAQFSSVFVWTLLASLTFGFCSIWSLHEVAMLACELDLPIGIDVPLTILSSILAVLFTFGALSSDLLWNRYARVQKKKARRAKRAFRGADTSMIPLSRENSAKYQLARSEEDMEEGNNREEEEDDDNMDGENSYKNRRRSSSEESDPVTPYRDDDYSQPGTPAASTVTTPSIGTVEPLLTDQTPDTAKPVPRPTITPIQSSEAVETYDETNSVVSESALSSTNGSSRRSSSYMGSNTSSYGLSNIINTAYRSGNSGKNAFLTTGEALYHGLTYKNIFKGFFWSLAITSMHYVGIAGLKIPHGYYTLNPYLFVLSGLISWIVCLVGCILMAQMETHLSQQFLFSFVATAGVAAMHFTGIVCIVLLMFQTNLCAQEWQPSLSGLIQRHRNTEVILPLSLPPLSV